MSAARECELVRSQLWGEQERSRQVDSHLEGCAECRQVAERTAWLDNLLGQHLLVAPPPAVLERSLRAARAVRLAAAPRPAGHWLSLPAYLLVGALLAIWGAQYSGWAAGLAQHGAELVSALWLVLASPAAWLLPAPDQLVATAATWLGLALLAWAFRGVETRRQRGAERPLVR